MTRDTIYLALALVVMWVLALATTTIQNHVAP